MKYWKRMFLVGICTMLLSVSVFSCYQGAKQVKAAVVVDDILMIVAICALFGIAVTVPSKDGTDTGDRPVDDDEAQAFLDWWKNIGGTGGGSSNNDVKEWMKDSGYMDENEDLTDEWYEHLGQQRPSGDSGDPGDDDGGSDLWKSIKNHFNKASSEGVSVEVAVGSALASVLGLGVFGMVKESKQGQYVADPALIPTADMLAEIQNKISEYPYDNGSRFLSCLVYHGSACFTGFPGHQSFCLVL